MALLPKKVPKLWSKRYSIDLLTQHRKVKTFFVFTFMQFCFSISYKKTSKDQKNVFTLIITHFFSLKPLQKKVPLLSNSYSSTHWLFINYHLSPQMFQLTTLRTTKLKRQLNFPNLVDVAILTQQ